MVYTMTMNEEKVQELMDAIQASKQGLQKDFTDQMWKLKSEVTAEQESSSQEMVKKLNKRTYQFKRKGNETQYTFNTTAEEHIDAARKELGKLNPVKENDKAILKKTGKLLKEGIKAIKVRQKHIKIADRAELGWAVVAAYEEDELALDSDDEKRIYRAEREAERVAKRKRPEGPMQLGRRPQQEILPQCNQPLEGRIARAVGPQWQGQDWWDFATDVPNGDTSWQIAQNQSNCILLLSLW